MAKKKEKPAPAKAAEASDAPKKKRSKLKLVVLALLPLMLAGGGYFGWTFFAGEAGQDTAHASEGEGGHGDGHGAIDANQVAAVPLPPEIAAESTFTYSFAMAELLNGKCGRIRMKALKNAVAEEAASDGTLVNLSWIAANRRMGTLTEKSCEYLVAEIRGAEDKAHVKAEEKAAAEAAAKGEGGGHATPAAHH